MGSIKWLSDLDALVREQFYQNAENMTSNQIATLCERHVSIHHKRFNGWHKKTVFKPLNVWKREGYDPEAIERCAEPDDIRKCPIYGWDEYRIIIHSTETGGQTDSNDRLDLSKAKKSKKELAVANPLPALKDAEEESDASSEIPWEDELSGREESDDSESDEPKKRRVRQNGQASTDDHEAIVPKPKKIAKRMSKEDKKKEREEKAAIKKAQKEKEKAQKANKMAAKAVLNKAPWTIKAFMHVRSVINFQTLYNTICTSLNLFGII